MKLENVLAVYRLSREGTQLCINAQAAGVTRANLVYHPNIRTRRNDLESRAQGLEVQLTLPERIVGDVLTYVCHPISTWRVQAYAEEHLRAG